MQQEQEMQQVQQVHQLPHLPPGVVGHAELQGAGGGSRRGAGGQVGGDTGELLLL